MQNKIELNIDSIIEEYSHYVFTIVDNIAGTSLIYQDKEEIVADCFYVLWLNQSKINKDLKSYLSAIARNCTYKRLKNKRIDIEYDDEKIIVDQYDIDKVLIIKEKLTRLNELEKELFIMYYAYGFKIKEIAQYKQLKISYIKVSLHRIRKKLKENKDGY